MSPYIITTATGTVLDGEVYAGSPMTRVEVATLDEARDTVRDILRPILTIPGTNTLSTSRPWRRAARLPESGGTIGPLPDGTVITVEVA